MRSTSKQVSNDFELMPSNPKLRQQLQKPKAANKEMIQRVQNMATLNAQQPPFWAKIFQPITIAADHMDVPIHEAALPIDMDTIQSWLL
jgi:hypothetical protein